MSEIGFGTYRLSKDECYEAVKHALESGVKYIDTAPSYGNIIEVGKAIKDSGRDRKTIYVTVKISEDCLKTGKISESLENTLNDMNLDYVDEAILHKPINPIENWKKLIKFKNEKGKGIISNIGVSNYNEELLNMIILDEKLEKPYVNQIEVNPFLNRGSLPLYCIKNNIKVVAHTPLAKGELFNNLQLNKLSDEKNISCSQLMLKWGINKGYRVIPRSHNFSHIDQNMTLDFNLSKEDYEILDKLDIGYSTHPQYLTITEKERYYKLRSKLKKERKESKMKKKNR